MLRRVSLPLLSPGVRVNVSNVLSPSSRVGGLMSVMYSPAPPSPMRVNVSNVLFLLPVVNSRFTVGGVYCVLVQQCFLYRVTGHNEASSASRLFPFHCWRVVPALPLFPFHCWPAPQSPSYTRLILINGRKLDSRDVRKSSGIKYQESENCR